MADYSADQISSYVNNILSGGGTNADVAAAMNQFGVSPGQVATAMNLNTADVQAQYNAVAPTGIYSTVAPTDNTGIASLPVAATPVAVPVSASDQNTQFLNQVTPVVTPVAAPVATPEVNTQPNYSNFSTPTTPAPIATTEASTPIATTQASTTTAAPLTGIDGFKDWYAQNPNSSGAEIGQALATFGVTPDAAAAVTGVSNKTAEENYLSNSQLVAQNQNLGLQGSALIQGGQIQVVGTDDNNEPEYALNGRIVYPQADGTWTFVSGNPTRGGTDTLTFTADANGNVAPISDPTACIHGQQALQVVLSKLRLTASRAWQLHLYQCYLWFRG